MQPAYLFLRVLPFEGMEYLPLTTNQVIALLFICCRVCFSFLLVFVQNCFHAGRFVDIAFFNMWAGWRWGQCSEEVAPPFNSVACLFKYLSAMDPTSLDILPCICFPFLNPALYITYPIDSSNSRSLQLHGWSPGCARYPGGPSREPVRKGRPMCPS